VLDETRWACAICSVEAVQCGQRAGWRDIEDRSTSAATGPRATRCSVQVPIGSLDQRTGGNFTVRATPLGRKVVQRRQRTAKVDFEERSHPSRERVIGIRETLSN
jgi:hypothetical protein